MGGYSAFLLAVPKYQSTATLALELRNEQIVDIESVFSGMSGDQTAINTELEVLRSRGLLQRLADDLDLLNDPEFNGALQPEAAFSIGRLLAGIASKGDGADSSLPPSVDGNPPRFYGARP